MSQRFGGSAEKGTSPSSTLTLPIRTSHRHVSILLDLQGCPQSWVNLKPDTFLWSLSYQNEKPMNVVSDIMYVSNLANSSD